ncbi:hypothetical protein L1987_21480 [Smallanthus sonchifolius]|uniref:Uncharacterized protein n=1 Tax=Smallanthus sonchifolius TaxID=185202 RepID=A0ACB9IW83_9ASTR|nr:hypothetical protein L1987_21480 [Smallanthus sonchifolius]
MDMNEASPSVNSCFISKASEIESTLQHRRLGHVNYKNMNKLVKGDHVIGLPMKEFSCFDNCIACLRGKQHKTSHKSKVVNLVDKNLSLVHMDLFGQTNMLSIGRKAYCLVITNDFSCFIKGDHVIGLPTKEFFCFGNFIACLRGKQHKTSHKSKVVNSVDKNLKLSKGTERQYSAPHTSQQNRVAEKRNRSLIEATRSMLVHSGLPITFWVEVVNIAYYA